MTGLPEDLRGASVADDGTTWRMVYARGSGVELATSTDARAWARRTAPILVAERAAGEGASLNAPSVAGSEGRWVLAYESGGSVFVAHAATPDGPFTRGDANPTREGRQAALEASSTPEGSRFSNPTLHVERTGTGRTIWRLYATRHRERANDGSVSRTTDIVFAASFDGVRFTLSETPAFSVRTEPSPDAPALVFERAPRSWMFFTGRCGATRRGIRVAVFPSEARLPISF